MENLMLEIVYYKDKDILSLTIPPRRPSRTGGNEHDFLILYDKDKPQEIVGFEILDFSLLIPHLYETGVVPQVGLRFSVENTPLMRATLIEVLEWAYRRYVVKHIPAWDGREAELYGLAL